MQVSVTDHDHAEAGSNPDQGSHVSEMDWCPGHGLPESKCTKCQPHLIEVFKAKGDWCAGHGFPESVCPLCNPVEPPEGFKTAAIETRVVRLGSPAIAKAADFKVVRARTGQRKEHLECAARITFDADRVADVRALVPGLVRRVRVKLGQQVAAGAPLFDLESAQVSRAQASVQAAKQRLLTAEANLARQQELRQSGIASARQIELAQQERNAAQTQMHGVEAALRMAGAQKSTPSGRYTLRAPIAGVVVRRPAIIGILATEDVSLATIADSSKMWALCDLPESQAGALSLGASMTVRAGGESLSGPVDWIAAEVDPMKRTVSARAVLNNPDGKLRANEFVYAHIAVGRQEKSVMVPRASVQRVEESEVVFVRLSDNRFAPKVVTRQGEGDWVAVEGAVKAGDEVVTTGAVLLRTEIMPGSIGAGCCEVVVWEED
jgi:cobalt-zinc-cadmium efflux system membrane fusion protein